MSWASEKMGGELQGQTTPLSFAVKGNINGKVLEEFFVFRVSVCMDVLACFSKMGGVTAYL